MKQTLGELPPQFTGTALPPLEPAVPNSEIITSCGGLCQETQQCPDEWSRLEFKVSDVTKLVPSMISAGTQVAQLPLFLDIFQA